MPTSWQDWRGTALLSVMHILDSSPDAGPGPGHPQAVRRQAAHRRSLVARFIRLSHRLWAFAASLALIGLAGHLLGLLPVQHVLPASAAIDPTVSAAILILCLSARLADSAGPGRTAVALTALVAGLTAARLVLLAWANSLPVFMAVEQGAAALAPQPAAGAVNTSATLFAGAICLFLIHRRHMAMAQVLALLATGLALISATGFLFAPDTFQGQMSPLSTLATLTLALALVGRTARHGVMRAFLSDGITGRIMRLQAIALCIVLPLFGLIVPRLVLGPVAARWLAINVVIELAVLLGVMLAGTLALERHDLRTRLLSRSIRREMLTDPLTGTSNRRALQARLRDLERSGGAVAVLAIDIDHFKAINDAQGHGAGDRVLCELTALLRANLRSGDMLARTGGDEFLAVLPGSSLGNAVAKADRLRRQVAGRRFAALEAGDRQITVSIGCAARPGFGTIEAMLAGSDQALYAAKRSGRNRVQPDGRPGDAAGATDN